MRECERFQEVELAHHVCDLVGVSFECSNNSSCVSIDNQYDKVVTGHSQHAAVGEKGEGEVVSGILCWKATFPGGRGGRRQEKGDEEYPAKLYREMTKTAKDIQLMYNIRE